MINEKKLAITIGKLYKELLSQGVPHPAVQGILSHAIAIVIIQPKMEEKFITDMKFKDIVDKLSDTE